MESREELVLGVPEASLLRDEGLQLLVRRPTGGRGLGSGAGARATAPGCLARAQAMWLGMLLEGAAQ